MTYTAFERDLLQWFADRSPDAALVEQLRVARVASRRYTGAGMYLDLVLPIDVQRLGKDVKSPIGGPGISAPGLANGAGSILFHENGVISFLEVYTFTDPLFENIQNYTLHGT